MAYKSPQINFLKKQGTILKLQSKRLYFIYILSILTLVSYVAVIMGVISYNVYLTNQIQKEDEKIAYEQKALQKLSDIEYQYSILKSKTGKSLTVTNSIQNHRQILETVFGMLPDTLSVSAFSIEEGGIVKFDAATSDPDDLAELFSNIDKSQHNPTAVRFANIDKLNINDSGVYIFNLSLKVEVNNPSIQTRP